MRFCVPYVPAIKVVDRSCAIRWAVSQISLIGNLKYSAPIRNVPALVTVALAGMECFVNNDKLI